MGPTPISCQFLGGAFDDLQLRVHQTLITWVH